ncbi:hypothetical protein LIER_30513 [Lithospermum erythrorhizon]|uniref:Uncharacterized protein n=1 Tax=Lithospermum erythrorhizon TaxID=34254 RepID=A0AAV3RTQ3_LITER
MHKLGGEEDFKETQQTHEAIQFFDDPEMIKNQNTCVVVGGVKENECEKLNIDEETTVVEHDQRWREGFIGCRGGRREMLEVSVAAYFIR